MTIPAGQILLVDGPVSIALDIATERQIIEAFDRLRPIVALAARQLHERNRDEWVKANLPSKEVSYGGTG